MFLLPQKGANRVRWSYWFLMCLGPLFVLSEGLFKVAFNLPVREHFWCFVFKQSLLSLHFTLLLMFLQGSGNVQSTLGLWRLSVCSVNIRAKPFLGWVGPCKTITDSGAVYWGKRSQRRGLNLTAPSCQWVHGNFPQAWMPSSTLGPVLYQGKNCCRFWATSSVVEII